MKENKYSILNQFVCKGVGEKDILQITIWEKQDRGAMLPGYQCYFLLFFFMLAPHRGALLSYYFFNHLYSNSFTITG